MNFDDDEKFADQLQKEFNAYEKFHREMLLRSGTLNPIDAQLELTDPTPCIRELFTKFDREYFWNSLGMVEVTWSTRMTNCAGICSFEGGNGLCKIALSAPLLSLRPRRDLVETLLHEMIHAYLFVTNNCKDRNDHGPEFHKHMVRINSKAGTNITVYHKFYSEVEYYQKHIWRCNGPCRNKKPYYGFVKRAINRAPGPNDPWWPRHRADCNGNFIKISGPEKKPKYIKKSKVMEEREKYADIRRYFSQPGSSQENVKSGSQENVKSGSQENVQSGSQENVQRGSQENVQKRGSQENVECGENSKIKTLGDLKEKPVTGVKMNTGTGVVITNTKKENMKSENPTKGSTSSTKSLKNTYETKQSVKTGPCTGVTVKPNDSNDEDVRATVRKIWANKFTNAKCLDNPDTKKMKLNTPAEGEGSLGKPVQITADEGLKNLKTKEVNNTSSLPETETLAVEYKKCPICNGNILKLTDDETEICLDCTFLLAWEDLSGAEITCESACCPCCKKWFKKTEINNHIDKCLT